MNMNPMNFIQFKAAYDRFKENHPKFSPFLKAAAKQAVKENSIVEIKVTTPEGQVMETNLKLKASDLSMFKELLDIFGE